MECKLSVDMKTGEEIGTRDAIDETARGCRIWDRKDLWTKLSKIWVIWKKNNGISKFNPRVCMIGEEWMRGGKYQSFLCLI